MLTGTRPAHSHRANTNRIDAVRSTQGRPAQAAMRPARWPLPAATRPARLSTDVATQLPDCSTLLTAASSCVEAPEVLDLEARRVALELAGLAVEREVVARGRLAAAVLGEQALLDALPVVRHELLLELGRQVAREPEALALGLHVLRVLRHRPPDREDLLEQDLGGLLVLVEPLGVGEQHLVARLRLRRRQGVELARLLGHHEVLVRDVEHRGLDVAAQQRRRPHLRARHEADLAELDALLAAR